MFSLRRFIHICLYCTRSIICIYLEKKQQTIYCINKLIKKNYLINLVIKNHKTPIIAGPHLTKSRTNAINSRLWSSKWKSNRKPVWTRRDTLRTSLSTLSWSNMIVAVPYFRSRYGSVHGPAFKRMSTH